MLERYAVKAARTVLRGGSDSNATPLPDHTDEVGFGAITRHLTGTNSIPYL